MRKEEVIKKTLENVFNKLTLNNQEFIDLYGFQVAEIFVPTSGKKIGLGLYGSSCLMKVYCIDDDYKDSRGEKFNPIVAIGYKYFRGSVVWNFEFVDDTSIIAEVSNFRLCVHNMQAVNYVAQMIEEEEGLILKQG